MTSATVPSVDVLAVGDASVDYFVRVPHIATADDKAIGRLVGVYGGGMSANLAAAARFAGARAALATAVGSDEPGRQALDRLAAQGVDVSASITVPGGHTWFCVIQLDRSGEKSLVGAVTEVKIPAGDQVSDDLLRTARVVAPLADDLDWAIGLAARARANGAKVAVDLEPDAVAGRWDQVRTLARHSDLVFCNQGAVQVLADGDPARCAELLISAGARVVVVTGGRHGAACHSREESWTARGPEIDVVDTTGAGDALAGAFTGSWILGRSLADSLRAGVATASLCVSHLGSRSYLDAGTGIETYARNVTLETAPRLQGIR
ncbi:carbohydrate kinase family protein [Nonomuraea angiospora]|uniref:Sugar/nucleoside kinase (Ribokinase family) n=1 Tax=Nonomuraea angiospora TaxID=46172 RepID=A0ABR9LUL9_9ACTN|nr:carbohydrate kinase family protein [Nonomuraea angiospora]MBE1584345.1 sugar/nucleoside kinase (ribokinase family) [Nonomuraea angiospora]